MHGGLYFRMSEKLLHLFYRHSFVDGIGRQRAAELVRVDTEDACMLATVRMRLSTPPIVRR